MTIDGALILLLVMAALAAMPSSSVALVVARSAAFNTKNGLVTAAGVVTGDLIFMTMALLGMSAVAEQMGALFVVVKYLAAAYLIWCGIGLIRSRGPSSSNSETRSLQLNARGDLATSFGAGLLLTLGDVKAIFFYASLLPTFLELATLTVADIVTVLAITIVAVGGVKSAYAVGARRLVHRAQGFTYQQELKLASGGLLIGAGTYLALKS